MRAIIDLSKENKKREQERMIEMRTKKRVLWAYLDGKKLVEVIRAALDNNMMVADMKKVLLKENIGHEVTFKIEE